MRVVLVNSVWSIQIRFEHWLFWTFNNQITTVASMQRPHKKTHFDSRTSYELLKRTWTGRSIVCFDSILVDLVIFECNSIFILCFIRLAIAGDIITIIIIKNWATLMTSTLIIRANPPEMRRETSKPFAKMKFEEFCFSESCLLGTHLIGQNQVPSRLW